MKYIFILLVVLIACSPKEKKQKDLFFYTSYITKYNNFDRDTFDIKKLKFHQEGDTLGASFSFEFEGKNHEIRMYADYCGSKPPVFDGGIIFYELDKLGIIYSKSNSFTNFYRRLRCTNDSIDRLIDIALENIIAIPELHHESVFAIPPMETSVKFEPPVVVK